MGDAAQVSSSNLMETIDAVEGVRKEETSKRAVRSSGFSTGVSKSMNGNEGVRLKTTACEEVSRSKP